MMESVSALQVVNSHPTIYKVELFPLKELVITFNEEILNGCSFSNLELALVDYVTSVVEPVGWTAVWRSTKESSSLDVEYDFVVEVLNVSREKLEADVNIKSIILSPSASTDVTSLQDRLQTLEWKVVPLTELYVISEDDYDESFVKTALAIEHIRFLQKHLCRPWDSEEDTYSDEVVKSRLQLYFDMKNNVLPKTMIAKIKRVLKEASRIQKELAKLYRDMNVSDSEAEISEDDLMQSISLRMKLEKLQAKMEMMENPVIRNFVMKKYSPGRSLKKQPKSAPVTYVVSKQFTKEIITDFLSLSTTAIIEFEHSPESAFKCSSSGDKIFIFPGVYECDNLGWLEGDVIVQGIGVNTEIILEATGNSEVLLNCCAEKVEIQNISLKAKSGLLSTVVVHHGQLELKRCILDSNDAKSGLLLLGGTVGTLENSIIRNSSEDGVQMRPQSWLTLNSSKILNSTVHGVQVDAESSLSPDSFTVIHINGSDISNNGGYGIFLKNVPIQEVPLQRPIGGFNVSKSFPWIQLIMDETTMMDSNGSSGVGVSSCATTPMSSSPNTSMPFNSTPQDDFNYSVLSDLLNEVNLSTEAVAIEVTN